MSDFPFTSNVAPFFTTTEVPFGNLPPSSFAHPASTVSDAGEIPMSIASVPAPRFAIAIPEAKDSKTSESAHVAPPAMSSENVPLDDAESESTILFTKVDAFTLSECPFKSTVMPLRRAIESSAVQSASASSEISVAENAGTAFATASPFTSKHDQFAASAKVAPSLAPVQTARTVASTLASIVPVSACTQPVRAPASAPRVKSADAAFARTTPVSRSKRAALPFATTGTRSRARSPLSHIRIPSKRIFEPFSPKMEPKRAMSKIWMACVAFAHVVSSL